jgi:hypothetical protein
MFDLKNSTSQTIDIDLNITSAQNIFQQALEKIGSYKDADYKSTDSVVLKGKSRYGLQGVPLLIQLDKTSDTTTKVTIVGKSDDVGGVGAKKCIERLISTFNTLNSNDTQQIEELKNTPSFKGKTGFTKKKLFFLVAGFIVILVIVMNSGDSFYGRYNLVAQGDFKEILEKQNTYIILNEDGTIILHAEMSGYPIVNREGQFSSASDKKSMRFIGTRFYDGQAPFSITLENGNLVIGESTYSK